MKHTHSLVVSVYSMEDIDKITKETKYINIDITNCNHDVIAYFKKNGQLYLYSEIINNIKGYIYVSYEEFFKAESILDGIYANMPENLNKIETARYLYISLAKCVYFDINIIPEKNENYSFSLISSINNIWGGLASGRVNDISISKIFYYLCRQSDLNVTINANYDTKEATNELIIDNQVLVVDLFNDIPFIQVNMKTRFFATYNDNIDIDKKIKYIKNKYNDELLDTSLRNIDYTKETCVEDILIKTEKIINVNHIKPVELGIIYNLIFTKYCPNYNIKINNLFLNNKSKNHFILISYNDMHYSYNYKEKVFVKVNNSDIINNIKNGKIGIYLNELIPNLEINLNV